MNKARRIILAMLLILAATSFIIPRALAEEGDQFVITAEASSSYYSFTPDKAVDGSIYTYWLGSLNMSPWWIQFDAGKVTSIGDIILLWYSNYYVPLDYDIRVSKDGIQWDDVYTNLRGEYQASGIKREINREARYVKLYIRSVNSIFPVLKEMKIFEGAPLDTPARPIRFQGVLKGGSGAPLEGTYVMTFRLYDAAAEGTALWEELHSSVVVTNGILDIELGNENIIELPFDKQYWLGIEVQGDGEMTPRFKMTYTPYAYKAVQI